MYDQEIIEKKASSPLATSLLAVAAACLIGAMVFQGLQLKTLTEGEKKPTDSAKAWDSKAKREYNKSYGELLADD